MKTICTILILFLTVSMAYANSSSHCIQILMTGNYESAVHAYEKVKAHQDARIEKINGSYVVRIGAYRDKLKAVSQLKNLKIGYPDAFIKTYASNSDTMKRASKITLKMKDKAVLPLPSERQPIKTEKTTSTRPPRASAPVTHLNPEIAQQASAVNAEEAFKFGMTTYNARKYESSISYLTRYISLSPGNIQNASALLIIGKGLEGMNRARSALGIFDHIIDQYPDSTEATLSIIATADIGVATPSLKYPPCTKGAKYYRDPVFAYDTALTKNIPTPMIEHIHLQKGRFLANSSRFMESWNTFTTFLERFPHTTCRQEVIATQKNNATMLIDQYYRSGDHLAVTNLFFQTKKKDGFALENTDTLLKVAISLANLGFFDDASNMIVTLRTNKKDQKLADIDRTYVEVQKMKNGFVNSVTDPKWDVFQSGQAYLRENNLPVAEQTLSPLKQAGNDAFWPKVTQYAVEDSRWSQKYRGYLPEKNRTIPGVDDRKQP